MAEVKNSTLPITGMTCANCAAAIERNVRKLPGVSLANVNLASEKLTVEFDSTQLDERGIIARVVKIGYGVAVGKAELPISGLRDNSDALGLEKLLARQTGILSEGASYAAKRISVEYIPGMNSIGELAQLVRKAGYDLVQLGEREEIEDAETKVRWEEVTRQKRLLVTGLGLSILKDGNIQIAGKEDLAGMRVGTQVNTPSETELKKIPGVKILEYKTFYLASVDLADGYIDAVVADHPRATSYAAVKRNHLKIVGKEFGRADYGITFCSRRDDLRLKFNEGLASIKESGLLDRLIKKWAIQASLEPQK